MTVRVGRLHIEARKRAKEPLLKNIIGGGRLWIDGCGLVESIQRVDRGRWAITQVVRYHTQFATIGIGGADPAVNSELSRGPSASGAAGLCGWRDRGDRNCGRDFGLVRFRSLIVGGWDRGWHVVDRDSGSGPGWRLVDRGNRRGLVLIGRDAGIQRNQSGRLRLGMVSVFGEEGSQIQARESESDPESPPTRARSEIRHWSTPI